MVKKKDKNDKINPPGTIISDMVVQPESKSELGGLVVEPEGESDKIAFAKQQEKLLKQTENEVLELQSIASDAQQVRSWNTARQIVEKFQPVPWFIWRISNYVLGKPGQINTVSEGFVLGLRRLLFATASDEVLGTGDKVNNVRTALKIVSSDVIAAVSVIHGVCRRLSTRQFDRIWRPILEDAILRSQIGSYVGQCDPAFGQGRGMLAGFASRVGLTILLATGELDQARQALELLASGKEISQVGIEIYDCDPLQVSAMMLSAAGCGRDASFGTVSYAYKNDISKIIGNSEQMKWLAAFTITENIRTSNPDKTDPLLWKALGLDDQELRQELLDTCKKLLRRGHGWSWLV